MEQMKKDVGNLSTKYPPWVDPAQKRRIDTDAFLIQEKRKEAGTGLRCWCAGGRNLQRVQVKVTHPNGDAYEGEYKDDKRHGQVRWLTPALSAPHGTAHWLLRLACLLVLALPALGTTLHLNACACIYINN